MRLHGHLSTGALLRRLRVLSGPMRIVRGMPSPYACDEGKCKPMGGVLSNGGIERYPALVDDPAENPWVFVQIMHDRCRRPAVPPSAPSCQRPSDCWPEACVGGRCTVSRRRLFRSSVRTVLCSGDVVPSGAAFARRWPDQVGRIWPDRSQRAVGLPGLWSSVVMLVWMWLALSRRCGGQVRRRRGSGRWCPAGP